MTIVQGTDEWFAARLGRASASRFHTILAKGRGGAESVQRKRYRDDLVNERLTGKRTVIESNPAMERGVLLEPTARNLYWLKTGRKPVEVGVYLHPEIMAAASPDGIFPDLNGGLEIKCPGEKAHREYMESGRAPDRYIPQMQGQMWLGGFDWVDFVSYNPDFPEGNKFFMVRVIRDQQYIEMLEGEVRRFLAEVDADIQAFLGERNDTK